MEISKTWSQIFEFVLISLYKSEVTTFSELNLFPIDQKYKFGASMKFFNEKIQQPDTRICFRENVGWLRIEIYVYKL